MHLYVFIIIGTKIKITVFSLFYNVIAIYHNYIMNVIVSLSKPIIDLGKLSTLQPFKKNIAIYQNYIMNGVIGISKPIIDSVTFQLWTH